MSASVYILYTGGTIGMKPSDPGNPTSPLEPASIDELLEVLGGLGAEEGITWELAGLTDEAGQPMGPLDSSAVNARHWIAIAMALERVYHDFDGFVVLHGTDTLAYTASALSFLLVNLAKPVVLTGAQRPIFRERNDARLNLVNALYVAGYKATGLPLVPEVTVCFGDALLRGNRTRKVSAGAWHGFDSPNYARLGDLGDHIDIYPARLRPVPDPESPFYVHRRLADQVMDATLFPGIRPAQLHALLEQPDLRGVVLRTFGSGSAPGDPELLAVIARAARSGTAVLVVTQCLEGRIDLGRYRSSADLQAAGVVSGFDLTPEAALTKLMWLLALESGPELPVQLQIAHRGEQSFNQYDLGFDERSPAAVHELSARAAGPVTKAGLQRAIITVRGVRFPEASAQRLHVFLNATGLAPDTSPADVRCIARLHLLGGDESRLHGQAEATSGVRRLLVADRPFRLTVTAEGGRPFCFDSLELSLLTTPE